MKIEDIEKAASELCTTEGQEEWLKDYGKYCFMDGARWRINAVWHDLPNDLPQKENTWILLELIFEGRLVYLPVEWVNDGEGAPKQAIRWAYIDDLLPERKEGWVNVYRDCDGANITKDDNIYSSKDAAIASAQIIDRDNYVATTIIKWEE